MTTGLSRGGQAAFENEPKRTPQGAHSAAGALKGRVNQQGPGDSELVPSKEINMESGSNQKFTRVVLEEMERSPRLAEIRAVYRSRVKAGRRKSVREPGDVAAYLREIWNPRTIELTEDFVVLCLNAAHEIIGWVKISSGGFSSTVVDPRLIFAIALQTASSALVLAHNHPSGALNPSDDDQQTTRRLVDAGRLLGIRVLDHVIVNRESAFSFRANGLM